MAQEISREVRTSTESGQCNRVVREDDKIKIKRHTHEYQIYYLSNNANCIINSAQIETEYEKQKTAATSTHLNKTILQCNLFHKHKNNYDYSGNF